jgi:hypothetical protein
MDDKCVHIIPNGATVDGRTGDVWVNGSRFMEGHASGACANVAPASAGGWEEAISANANTSVGGGADAYSALNSTWVVPSEPVNNNNNSMVMIFSSVEQCSNHSCGVGSGGTIGDIMQPVLQWNNANNGETHQWEITAEYGSTSLGYYQTGGEVVNVGDSIYGELALQSNGQWLIYVYDLSTGAYGYFYWTPTPGNVFNYAQAGVLEAYGTQSESAGPASCNDLPASGSVTFYVGPVAQEGYGDILPSWFDWAGLETPSSCGWGQSFVNPGGYSTTATLKW